MQDAFICDAVRTPIGRYGGVLAPLRADDLAAASIKALAARHPGVDWGAVDDVVLGCANQAGEDNRNVARMALLLAGLPVEVPGTTINRLCGSSLDAIAIASRSIRCGESELAIAGGLESMSRAPFVMAKADAPFSRAAKLEDTTMGWRFIHPRMQQSYGVDTMPETAENVAAEFHVSREDQDAFALRSHQNAIAAQAAGRFTDELIPVPVSISVPGARAGKPKITDKIFSADEGPRADTSAEALAKLKPAFHAQGTVTAGNSSQTSDGAAATVLMEAVRARELGIQPLARLVAYAVTGCLPEEMGIGPITAIPKALRRAGLTLNDIGLIELNEAFAAQVVAIIRELDLDPDRINVNGGAIALGHPLGCTGAKLTASLLQEMKRRKARYGMVTMCVGAGMGAAGIFELL